MVTDGIRNRNCHAMELSMPAANTPMEADSWYAAVNRPKKMTFRSLRRYLVATTRKAEPATCSPAVCSTRASYEVGASPLQGDEVTEGSIDEAHDAEHDAGERGDEGRLRRRADVGADLLEHEVESLQAQGAEHEGDQQRNKGADGHLVAGHRIVERVDGGLRWCGVDCRCGCVAGRHVSSSFASSLGFCDVVLRLFRW